nr:HAD-IA family hydrolase [Pullulanibacillus pueri]
MGNDELVHELFYFAHYANHCELFPEVNGVLNKLSQSYRLGIISNAMPSMDWIFDRLGIRQYFDSIILSAFVNVANPDEAIYHLALNTLQHAEKAESVFIDDKRENVEAAKKVGMLGIHLDREKRDLLQLLKDYELL